MPKGLKMPENAGWESIARGMRGKYFAFEGPDCSGKTTLTNWLIDRLRKCVPESDVVHVREPGGTDVGERIREILLNKEACALSVVTEIMLFFAARVELYNRNIIPALDQNKIVVADRCVYSTFAYQGIDRFNQIDGIVSLVLPLVSMRGDVPHAYPEHAIFLDIDERCDRLVRKVKSDRFETRSTEFVRSVVTGYRALTQRPEFKDIVTVVNADRPLVHVHDHCFCVLYDVFGKRS